MSENTTTLSHRPRFRLLFDQHLFVVFCALAGLSVVAVASAVTFLEQTRAGEGALLGSHVVKLLFGLCMMLAFSFLDYHFIARHSRKALIFSISLLILLQVAGVASGGATRWLHFVGFNMQPSDLAKIALLVYTAYMLARKQAYVTDFKRGFLPTAIWIGAVVGLIGLENLSTGLLVLTTCLIVCFVARVRVVHLGSLVAAGAVLAVFMLLFSPARAARVESFLGTKIFSTTDEKAVFDQQDEGYQATQARIAFAMGGLTGVGIGKSVQRDFLPAPYNDFIFAIIAEEFGIVFALIVLLAFLYVLYRGFLRIARHAPDPLGLFLAVGVTSMLSLYAFIHSGVCIGLLPVTGLPMPFVSYGGSALMAGGILTGILLNISKQSYAPVPEEVPS